MKYSDRLIEEIINLEWNEFQKVNNEGGRASCQEDWEGFRIYRRGQFKAWNIGMIESYYSDLTMAIDQGRNLLTEKYARMMETTAPEQYQRIKEFLPVLSDRKLKLIESICEITIKWAKEFAEEYPGVSKSGRSLQTTEDGAYSTSVETYSRGELSTYSEETLRLYCMHIKHLLSENKNMFKMEMENTVLEMGYSSLDEAENRRVR